MAAHFPFTFYPRKSHFIGFKGNDYFVSDPFTDRKMIGKGLKRLFPIKTIGLFSQCIYVSYRVVSFSCHDFARAMAI